MTEVDDLYDALIAKAKSALWGIFEDRPGSSDAYLETITKARRGTAGDLGDLHDEAAEWAMENSAKMLRHVDTVDQQAVARIVAMALRNGVNPEKMQRAIGRRVGLTPDRVQQIEFMRQRLVQNGTPPGVARSIANETAKRHRSHRAETIASTELQRALIEGQRALWAQAAVDKLFDTKAAQRRWVVHPGCCDACERKRFMTVPWDQPWPFDGPPAHPNCRCSEQLVTGSGRIIKVEPEEIEKKKVYVPPHRGKHGMVRGYWRNDPRQSSRVDVVSTLNKFVDPPAEGIGERTDGKRAFTFMGSIGNKYFVTKQSSITPDAIRRIKETRDEVYKDIPDVVDAVQEWQNGHERATGSSPIRAAADWKLGLQDGVAHPLADGARPSPNDERRAETLLNFVAGAKPVGHTLYRGITLPRPLAVGDVITDSIGSWSGSDLIARFMANYEMDEHGQHPVVLKMENGEAVNITPLSSDDDLRWSKNKLAAEEYLASGRYRVTKVERKKSPPVSFFEREEKWDDDPSVKANGLWFEVDPRRLDYADIANPVPGLSRPFYIYDEVTVEKIEDVITKGVEVFIPIEQAGFWDRGIEPIEKGAEFERLHPRGRGGRFARKFASLRPPKAKTVELPDGAIRLYHYTKSLEQLDSIREHGVLRSHAVGETYGEPNMVWASAEMPKSPDSAWIEFYAFSDDLDIGSGMTGTFTPEEIAFREGAGSNVTMRGDIPVDRITTYYEPWMSTYDYLDNEAGRREVMDGFYDNFTGDSLTEQQILKAIETIRQEELAKIDKRFDESKIKRDRRGRFARKTGGWLLDVASHMRDLPEDQQDDIISAAAQFGYHPEDMRRRMNEAIEAAKHTPVRFDPTGQTTVYDYAKGWYDRVNADSDALADEFAISDEQAAAIIGVLSSNNQWETTTGSKPNLDVAVSLLQALTHDATVMVTQGDADYMQGEQGTFNFDSRTTQQRKKPFKYANHGTVPDADDYVGVHKMSELPPAIAALKFTQQFGWAYTGHDGRRRAGMGLNTGWVNIEKAIRIYRGEDMSDVVGGNKIRSFVNTINDGGGTSTVIDRWMVGLMAGVVEDGAATNLAFDHMTTTDTAKKVGVKGKTKEMREKVAHYTKNVGLYPLFADAVRQSAKDNNLDPADAQAIAWYMAQEMRKKAGRPKRRKNLHLTTLPVAVGLGEALMPTDDPDLAGPDDVMDLSERTPPDGWTLDVTPKPTTWQEWLGQSGFLPDDVDLEQIPDGLKAQSIIAWADAEPRTFDKPVYHHTTPSGLVLDVEVSTGLAKHKDGTPYIDENELHRMLRQIEVLAEEYPPHLHPAPMSSAEDGHMLVRIGALPYGTGGVTMLGGNAMMLDQSTLVRGHIGDTVDDRVSEDRAKSGQPNDDQFFAQAQGHGDISYRQWVTAHEWGHAVDEFDDAENDRLAMDIFRVLVSEGMYPGKYGLSSPRELMAEMFAYRYLIGALPDTLTTRIDDYFYKPGRRGALSNGES